MNAQTAREAMLAEILGEAVQIADRLDALKAEIPAAAKAAAGAIAAASADATAQQRAAGAELLRSIQSERAAWRKGTGEVTQEVTAAALVVHGAANRFLWLIVGLCGLLSAACGGLGAWAVWGVLAR